MSKRSKKRSRNRQHSTAGQAPTQIEAAAHDALERGRFREAIAGFKDLLKREDRAPWREGLAAAYAGRAAELTAKGMLKEALVMWENRQRLGEAATPRAAHMGLLLRLGRTGEALRLFDPADPALPSALRGALRSQLATRHLAGDPAIAAQLAADDPVRVHGEAARTALGAYCSGDAAALEQALAAIPFRSPYRDWVQILKALQCLADDRAKAADLLARVSDESAFAPLRRAAELALAPDAELSARAAAAGDNSRRFALALRGWGPERIDLLGELQRLGPDPAPRALLALLHRHRHRLGDGWLRRYALRLLTGDHPKGMQWLTQLGAPGPTAAEQALVAARHSEQRRADPWDELERWDRVAAALEAQGAPSPGSDEALRIALVLRRFAQTSGILAHAQEPGDVETLEWETAQRLERSLAYDPDDLATYVELSAYYRRSGALKEARRVLAPALTHWPDDVRILTEALDTAVAGGAFRKAAGFARRILELDPINRSARDRLVQAHLDHALKRIRTGRLDLARRELASAAEWDSGGRFRDPLGIADALLDLASAPQDGIKSLRGVIERLGDGLASRFAVAVTGLAAGRKPGALFKRLGLRAPRAADVGDLMALLRRLREWVEGGRRLAPDILAYLDRPLHAAARLPLSRQEYEVACETLRHCRWDAPRVTFARAALRRWRAEPLFVLHALEAQFNDRPWEADHAAINLLDTALERSHAAGDHRTHHRLLDLAHRLATIGPAPGFASGGLPVGADPLADMADNLDPAALAGVIEQLGLGALAILIDQLGLDATCKALGLSRAMRRELHELEREVGREAVVEMLGELILAHADDPPPEPRPAPRSRRNKGPDPGRARPQDEPDDDPFDQLDLFR